MSTKKCKKCEIFAGILAEIFHKCKMAFNCRVFRFGKGETTFNLGAFFCGVAMSGAITRKTQKAAVCVFFFEITLQVHRKYLICNAMTFFAITYFCFEIGIVKRRHHKAGATTFLQKVQGTFAHFSALTQKVKS